jgi:hypothetical protein
VDWLNGEAYRRSTLRTALNSVAALERLRADMKKVGADAP